MRNTRIEVVNITESINKYFIDCINSGEFKVGEKIPSENTLTQKLGVSRASLRVSIKQFVALGLMQSYQGKGTYLVSNNTCVFGNRGLVAKQDYKDIKDVLSFRLLIEPEAAMLCAKTADDRDKLIEALEQSYKKMEDNIQNAELFIEADMNFHIAIAYGSGNSVLGDAIAHIFASTMHRHKQINNLFGFKDGLSFHRIIIDAIKDENAKKASSCMHDHLMHAILEINKLDN